MAVTSKKEYMLYVSTHGMGDPNRAALIFSAANAMVRQDKPAVVALLDDAVFLMEDTIAKCTKPMPPRLPLDQLVATALKGGVEIYC